MEHEEQKHEGFADHLFKLMEDQFPWKKKAEPEAADVTDTLKEGAEDVSEALEGTHLGEVAEGLTRPLGFLTGALELGSGLDKINKAKTVDEGNEGVDDMANGVADVAGTFGPAGKAVQSGLKAGVKIARFMEDTSKDLGLYGQDDHGNMSLSDHACKGAVEDCDESYYDADGTYHGRNTGPTVGGVLKTIGQSTVDAVTFLPRLALKGVSALGDFLFGPSEEEKADQAKGQEIIRQSYADNYRAFLAQLAANPDDENLKSLTATWASNAMQAGVDIDQETNRAVAQIKENAASKQATSDYKDALVQAALHPDDAEAQEKAQQAGVAAAGHGVDIVQVMQTTVEETTKKAEAVVQISQDAVQIAQAAEQLPEGSEERASYLSVAETLRGTAQGILGVPAAEAATPEAAAAASAADDAAEPTGSDD
jgi:hypothetical protein